MKPPEVLYVPRNTPQKRLHAAWEDSQLVILTGPAGTGKTAAALGEALSRAGKQQRDSGKLWLCRPTVAVEEDLGFLPGDLTAKLLPWLAPFGDCLGNLGHSTLQELADWCELVPLGMLRGRTISHGTLIVDEAQNATRAQLVCAATRVGRGGRVVLCGDPEQADGPEALTAFASQVRHVPGVTWLRFDDADQVRSEFVTTLLAALR